ncbi:hypothetical protein M1I87_002573 [Serratia marcescens]|nr:hypothetical protein [Serratia marcescens]
MKRWAIIFAVFAIVYYIYPGLKSTVQNITMVMIALVALVVSAVILFKALAFLIKLSNNDKCKIYQEKDGKITRVD